MNMKNTPSLKSSKAVDQQEIQNAKQSMNNGMSTGQETMGNMTAGIMGGGTSNLSSSTAVGQQEVQNVRRKIQESGTKNLKNTGLQ
ncbi:hypothetical protein [Geosporobacter ferrireducens]|uniref:Uncharacterized protein n=1 Tax=Geosporobacter ferrireducens TaxID=1424294 RepID=A0A1D8GDN7_9FIRM|nr:hypothetical protein [Geosporobacter ferrireducens]AOT69035.1 hypothetical protein Gferi_05355 [Geosporobacter ferrireducens]MTI56702.1 hypothetical protein [Geosporobacter ferrireducens]